jgi:serine/threonine-protein kinase
VSQRRIRTRKHILLATLLILSGILAWSHRGEWVLAPGSHEATTRVAQPSTGSQVYFGPPNSIAVLPFNCVRYPVVERGSSAGEEASDEPSAAADADPMLAFGLAESLQELLVQIPGLQVTATTSSFFFADSAGDLPVLAERLKVRHLLDGCIRRIDKSLRIEASVYDVRAASYPWSQSFDAPVGEVFDLIHQIVASAANEVRPESGADVPAATALSFNVWLQMLEAGHHYRQMDLPGLERARLAYENVLAAEPGFARAWLGLAEVYLQPVWQPPDDAPGYEHSRLAARKALQLDPGLAGAHLILSRISRIYDWDFEQALAEGRVALDLLEGDADVLENASAVEFIFGRFKPAINLLDRAISRNPVVLNKLLRLGLAYEFAGDYDQALVTYRQLLGLNPDYPGVYAFRARVKLAQAKPESALKEADQEVQPFWQRYARILALDALGRLDESNPELEAMIRENSHNAAFQLAEIHAMRGNVDLAFQWLERAREQRDGGMSELLGNPLLLSLHEDERWPELVNRIIYGAGS